jgi:hypothetical protein
MEAIFLLKPNQHSFAFSKLHQEVKLKKALQRNRFMSHSFQIVDKAMVLAKDNKHSVNGTRRFQQ